ncbi:MAG: ATP-binding cassette domain-containing protein [Parasporobacterium sp.]|nr:ATP-binding cassette domain-containing protein [Parasporobacterium sp.]
MEQMKEGKLAIQISDVKKMYKLGQIGGGTLQADLQSWWARKRGKEDPNTKIGQEQRLVGQTFMALNGINLTVYKGEALGIIGSNGAGKSTLLKLLSRVTAPTAGEIDIYGRVASMLEVGTGFNGEMTGRENVYMNGAILGMTKAEIDAKMEDIIEFSEVREFIDTPVKRYSSGMYVKLAFSVAAHLDSEIMIMDEVLAVGDMAFQKKCLEKMRMAANQEGRTVLYVSHNMNTIRQLCDRCIVLDKGKVVYDGDVEEAVDIYLAFEKSDNVSIDYNDIPRLNWLSNTKIRTLRASYLDRDSIRFNSDEPLKIKLEWVNEKDIKDLCLRVEILKADRTPIGTSMLYDFYSGQKGEEGSIAFMIDISMFVPGNYTMNYTFFERNEFGSNKDVDCVHGLYFDIQERKDINWNSRSWGNICLPSMEIITR